VEEDDEGGPADDGVCFGDLRALLELVEDGVLRQLESCALSACGVCFECRKGDVLPCRAGCGSTRYFPAPART
jgi:hypothetical protein